MRAGGLLFPCVFLKYKNYLSSLFNYQFKNNEWHCDMIKWVKASPHLQGKFPLGRNKNSCAFN